MKIDQKEVDTGQSLNLDNKIRMCNFNVDVTKYGANSSRKTWEEISFSAQDSKACLRKVLARD